MELADPVGILHISCICQETLLLCVINITCSIIDHYKNQHCGVAAAVSAVKNSKRIDFCYTWHIRNILLKYLLSDLLKSGCRIYFFLFYFCADSSRKKTHSFSGSIWGLCDLTERKGKSEVAIWGHGVKVLVLVIDYWFYTFNWLKQKFIGNI